MPILVLNDRAGIDLPTPDGIVKLNPKALTNISAAQFDYLKKNYPCITYMLDNGILETSQKEQIDTFATEAKVIENEVKIQEKQAKKATSKAKQ